MIERPTTLSALAAAGDVDAQRLLAKKHAAQQALIERPSELPQRVHGPVALDTETNGLYKDSGARVAVVSLAWIEGDTVAEGCRDHYCWELTGEAPHDVDETRDGCRYCRGRIVTAALPFAQGKNGKLEDDTVGTLFDSPDPNLGAQDWSDLLDWLVYSNDGLGLRLVMQNAPFDLEKMQVGTLGRPYYNPGTGFGREIDAIRVGLPGVDLERQVVWDTQVANREIWPTHNTSLKPTAERLWGTDQGDEMRALKPHLGPKTDPRYDLVPWEVIKAYAAKDAYLTIKLAHRQWDLLDEGVGHRPWIGREHDYMYCLHHMQVRGLPYDAQGSLDVAAELRKRRERVEIELPFRPTEPQAKKYFFSGGQAVNGRGQVSSGLGLPPYATTPTGQPQLTARDVNRLIKDHPPETAAGRAARAWRDWTKLDTALTMWYLPYAEGIGPDQRLRTYFRHGGTRSERLSCERVNLQAIPHDYRLGEYEILEGAPTPRQLIGQAAAKLDGWELWEFDLKQAELRVAALWAECQLMLDAIARDDDLHGITTAELFGLSETDREWFQYRQIGKRGNFTLCFGAGAPTFAGMVEKESGILLPDHESQRIVRDWNNLYPEFGRAISRHSWAADRAGHVRLANGRFRWFRPGEDTHKAFNQRVQASLAEFQKDWTIRNDRLMHDTFDLDARGTRDGVGRGGLLITIHDSQVALLPAGREGEFIASEIRRHAVELWQQFFPGVPGEAEAKRWS